MAKKSNTQSSLVISYLILRRLIGLLGIIMPFLVVIASRTSSIQPSISAYYYTDARNIFVGILFSIGSFLIAYQGYERSDQIAGWIAGIASIGVALFPTTPEGSTVAREILIGRIHLAFAATFFLTISYLLIKLFTKSVKYPITNPSKLRRNRIYKLCGYTMLTCIALILIFYTLLRTRFPSLANLNPVFWLETVAILAFGIAWLTKGEALRALRGAVQRLRTPK